MFQAILVFGMWLTIFVGLSVLFLPLGILWFLGSAYAITTIR